MTALWAFIAFLTPSSALEAPVYTQVSESVLRRSGTFQYKAEDDARILFCIASPPRVTLRCVVRTPLDLLVVIEATATEQGT